MIDSILLVRPYAAEKKEFPMGLLYVGTALRQKGYKVRIIDLQDTPELEESIEGILAADENMMLGISALAPHYYWVKRFTTKIKEKLPNCKIIVGGHIAIVYEVLLNNSGADYICIGEGEETLPELINCLNAGGDVTKVPGLALRDSNQKAFKSPYRPLLEEFFIPDYSLIDISRYLIHPQQDYFFRRSKEYQAISLPEDKLGVIMFSRGCIGSCSFCYRHLSGFRQMSVEKSWDHLMNLHDNFGVKYFRIDDELFTNNPEWFYAICQKIIESNLGIMFRITGLRVDTISEEQLALLKKAGCIGINYGIESCSQEILDKMLKRVTVEQNIKAVNLTLKYGIQTMAYIIWGYLNESKKTIRETIDGILILNLPAELVSIFYLVALPGTTVYRQAIAAGKITNEDEYLDSLYVIMTEREGIHGNYLINLSQLSRSELRRYEHELFLLLKLKKRLKNDKLITSFRSIFDFLPSSIFNLIYSGIKISADISFKAKRIFKKIKLKLNKGQINFQLFIQYYNSKKISDQASLLMVIDWLKSATKACSNRGVSRGYSLILEGKFKKIGWQPPYPETTGYIIPTLMEAAVITDQPEKLYQLALDLGRWEIDILLPMGGVRGGHFADKNTLPAVFDTGQVIRGFLALSKINNERIFIDSAKKCANWILSVEDNSNGCWTSGNATCVNSTTTTYNIFALTPVIELGLKIDNQDMLEAGRRAAQYALNNQNEVGWFKGADFQDRPDALLHTLAYTIDGLLEAGILLKDDKFIDSAKMSADALIKIVRPNGFMPGRYFSDWSAKANWSCLTGQAQMGIIWLKFFNLTGDKKYLQAAIVVKDFIKQRQNTSKPNLGGLGAIWGSWPVGGAYQPYQAINWAAKFYADLLIELGKVQKL